MEFSTMEVVEQKEETSDADRDDLVHIVCLHCNPDNKALCGCYPKGHWVVSALPEEECIVCLEFEKTHICKDGFNWGDAE